jgi:hypothetical protein
MAKYNLQKGDKINACTPSSRNENAPYNKAGGNNPISKPLTVTKTFSHGVRTQGYGYVHNNNIISKHED